METVGSGKNKPALIRRLFFFMLGLLALVGISSIASEWISEQGADNRIGVVDITGLIHDSQHIVKQIKKFREDKRIRGIVLRIDSPGGSVGPAQEIYDEILWKAKDEMPDLKEVQNLHPPQTAHVQSFFAPLFP